MKVAAYLGNQAHAPANSRLGLVSAFTGGADILHFAVRLSASNRLVLAADADTAVATGVPGKVRDLKVTDLRKLDYSKGFVARGSAPGEFSFLDPQVADRRHPIDVLDEMIDELPGEADWMIELRGDPGDDAADSKAAELLAALINGRRRAARTILLADTAAAQARLRQLCPAARFAVRDNGAATPAADYLIVAASDVWNGTAVTPAAAAIKGRLASGNWPSGAYLLSHGPVSEPLIEAAASAGWIGVLAAESMFDLAGQRPSFVKLDESFAGNAVNKAGFSLGYAKANKYAHVTWDEGVHVNIAAYDGPFPDFSGSTAERELERLKWDVINIGREWPFYSGGGVGVMHGISGDFAAEVDYRVAAVGQATTLEMAVTNVDPGAHRDTPPTSFRDKDSFFDPHGAPPFIGVEHDEDDGFRINWNLGTEYDNNQYGRPVGDGRIPRGARLRLERRGAWFAAYYREPIDAAGNDLVPRDWVCVGVARNESLNRSVFLRCVGKRWRQEKASDPSAFEPVIANRFTFRNLHIACFPTEPGV